MPPRGTINVHGSLLPQYRGAAPINWAIINGEKETGVTTFKLKHEIDTGNILLQERIPIAEDETAGELHDKMKEVGAQLLVRTVEGVAKGSLSEQAQSTVTSEKTLKHAPKIFTATCTINWEKSCDEVHNLIRGLSPYPGAITSLSGKLLKVYKSKKEECDHNEEPGNVLTDNKKFLKFACSNGYVHIIDIQPEGKKRMGVEDFLRGHKVSEAQS
jgi:methionyl-tRNA formyltransferase